MGPTLDHKDHELHVQFRAGDEKVEINYWDEGHLHLMERDSTDALEKTLIRIGRNFHKKEKKKKKKKGGSSPNKKTPKGKGTVANAGDCDSQSTPEGVLLSHGDGSLVYDLSKLTNQHWKSGMKVFINEHLTLTVVLNAPVITSIGVFPRKYARVNNFLVPSTSHFFTTGVEFSWFAKPEEETDFHFVSAERLFCPSPELVGCSLKLFCSPYRIEKGKNTQTEAETDLSSRVYGRTVVHYLSKHLLPEESLPKALECRRLFLQTPHPTPVLRLVCFNILASGYARSDHALACLYNYLQHPELHLSEEYRLQLTVKELLAYRGDIVCLQEVDLSAYDKYLGPIFSQHGYTSHHTCKSGTAVEGCATFVSADTFNILHTVDVSIRDAVERRCSEPGSYLHHLLLHHPEVHEILSQKVTTIAQISILSYKDDPTHLCLVANTHLFYHPDAEYIRLLQIHEIMLQVESIKKSILLCNDHENVEYHFQIYLDSLAGRIVSMSLSENERDGFEQDLNSYVIGSSGRSHTAFDRFSDKEKDKDEHHERCSLLEVSCIIMGDLNSPVSTGAIEYMKSGIIERDHSCWESLDVFTWSNGNGNGNGNGSGQTGGLSCAGESICEHVPLRLTHDFALKSAAGYPPFTNYTQDFKELLDYIFVERDKYDVVTIAPLPSEEVLLENCAIPSEVFPSDHLSLVVDVRLSENREV